MDDYVRAGMGVQAVPNKLLQNSLFPPVQHEYKNTSAADAAAIQQNFGSVPGSALGPEGPSVNR